MGGNPISSAATMVVLSVCVTVICSAAEEVKGYPPSINCAKQDCASYQVIHSQKEFEIRSYKNATWIASGNFTTVSYNIGYSAAYIDAYLYYRAGNEERFSWDNNTQPVLIDIVPNTSYDSIYRAYLLVPNDYQNKTLPKPYEGSDVTAVSLPRTKFAAVARFDGRLTDPIIAAELAALKKSLAGTPWESAAAAPASTIADYQFQLASQENDRVNEVILWFD